MIIIDSTVLVDLLRREPATVAFLHDLESEDLATTSLNVAEVLRGEAHDARRLARARKILAGLAEVPFGPRAAQRYARLMQDLDRAGRPLAAIDGMIAAVALAHGATIVTDDRDFHRVPGLAVMDR